MKSPVLFFIALLFPLALSGQGHGDRLIPKWCGNAPGKAFKVVRTDQYSSAASLGKLVETLGTEWNVGQSIQLQNIDIIERKGGVISGSSQQQVSRLDIMADGKPVSIKCQLVDEWSRKGKGSSGEYYSLYQVADLDAPFIPCQVTNRYGILPMFFSLIPGAGQFYKGDVLKGSLMLAGCAAGIGGTVFLESRRRACIAQMKQTHDVNLIKRYSADERNFGMARNVTLGITAALYIYNLIDAAAAPGARRVVVDPSGIHYNF